MCSLNFWQTYLLVKSSVMSWYYFSTTDFLKSTVNLYLKYLTPYFFSSWLINRFTSMFSNGLFYIVLQGYISYSFIINGMLVIPFKIKTLRSAPRNPIPVSMHKFRTRRSTVLLLLVSVLSTPVILLLPCCFHIHGVSFSIFKQLWRPRDRGSQGFPIG